jgi:predicted amidohydrolase
MKTLARFNNFDSPIGWTTWTPRPDISPIFSIDPYAGRAGNGALRISADCSPAAIGSWKLRIPNITPGQPYRLIVHYRATAIPHPRQSISARLDWHDDKNNRPRQPDNAIASSTPGEWSKIDYTTLAPEGAQSVTIELELRWTPGGVVWFDDLEFSQLDSLPARPARIATVFHRPRNTVSSADSVARFCQLIDSAAPTADLICLPEGISVVGTNKSYYDVAESLSGPTTSTLAQLARKHKTHLVAGLYERVGPEIYNTSVLIGRTGKLLGSYRKTHLPQEEVEAGITPGDSFPTFSTDFANIGMMICWDLQFPEPARNLARNGAEIIALPIWGGSPTLALARAIENHIFLVSSTYDMRSFIVSPTGQVLTEATIDQPLVTAQIDLAQILYQPWLGNMKHRTWKESRPDLL